MRHRVDIVKPYKPEISLGQILAFKSGRPETYTPSKLVNTVCELLADKQYLCDKVVAQRLGLDPTELSHALKVITGLSTPELRAELIAKRIRQLRDDYPDIKTDELAKAVGFADYPTLWRFVDRNKKRFPELFGDEAETKNRMKVLVEQLIGHESITVQRLYINLPFRGGADEEKACLRLLYSHSRIVADIALDALRRHPELELKAEHVEECALLHNIGIVMTNTPELHCHGREPYVKHGIVGAEWLTKHRHAWLARPARLHLGSGIIVHSRKTGQVDLIRSIDPLLDVDKLICYASCFCSVFSPERRKTVDEIRASLSQYGADAVQQFDALHRMFG